MILYILAALLLSFGCFILYMDHNKKWPEDQKQKKGQ